MISRSVGTGAASTTAAGAVLLLLCAGACDGDRAASSANTATVRDSAGVTIVESAAPAWAAGEEWTLSAEPMLAIGLAAGADEYLLDRVRGALRLDDGTLVVVNGGSSELRFFDRDGRYLHSVGGQGSGPAEFGYLDWVQLLRGDTLLAYDAGNHRLSRFSADGEFVATITPGDLPAGGFPMILGAFPDGSILAKTAITGGEPPPQGVPHRTPEEFVRFTASGDFAGSIATQPGTDLITRSSTSRSGIATFAVMEPLFNREQLAGIVGELAVFGSNDAYELQLYRTDGALERIIRRSVDPRPATDAIVEAARAHMIAAAAPGEARRRREESLGSLQHMPTLPFYQNLIGDFEGNLWVEEYGLPGEEPAAWAVFDAEGRLLGHVRMPERFRPTQIGLDFVVGIALDELDVERVLMYALVRPEGR